MVIPTRFLGTDAARATFGAEVDRIAPYLLASDPLADAVIVDAERDASVWKSVDRALRDRVRADDPESVRALFAELDDVPRWVDFASLDRAGRVLLCAGPLGGLVLGLKSLVSGYASPAGNKPLALSGRLNEAAPRRLSETARYVFATCSPGGLHRHGEGFAIAIKVRLMHAKVRRLAQRHPKWDAPAWGVPINQHDMVATSLLFSVTVLEGLRQLGVQIATEEADAYVGLWRYAAWLMGTTDELLPKTEAEGLRLARLIVATEGAPDEDSRALTHALLHVAEQTARTPRERRLAERRVALGVGVCRHLVGAEMADALGVPKTSARFAGPLAQGLVGTFELARARSWQVADWAEKAGDRYWRFILAEGAKGPPMTFAAPTELRGQSVSAGR